MPVPSPSTSTVPYPPGLSHLKGCWTLGPVEPEKQGPGGVWRDCRYFPVLSNTSLSCFGVGGRDQARILMFFLSFSYQPCFDLPSPSLCSMCYCRVWGCCWGAASWSP